MVIKALKAVLITAFASLVFTFTLFGEDIYINTKKHVETARIQLSRINEEQMYIIPKSAYLDGYVFSIVSEDAFMITHTVLEKVAVSVAEIENEDEYYRIVSDTPTALTILKYADSSYYEGQKVIVNNKYGLT